MVCIYCGGKTHVTNSRQQRRTNTIWRRRECLDCQGLFTSQEGFLLEGAVLVNSAQKAATPFSRDVLWLSVYDSLGHRKQPLADATGLTDTIISKLLPHIEQAQLDTSQIKKTTSEVLRRFDKAAATYYLAYHPQQ